MSRADLLRELATLKTEPALPAPADDRMIREKLLAVLRGQPWITPALIGVLVRGGVVHLWGSVHSEAERNAVCVATRNVAGVRGFEDHLTLS